MFICSTKNVKFEYLNNKIVICNYLFSTKSVKMPLKYSFSKASQHPCEMLCPTSWIHNMANQQFKELAQVTEKSDWNQEPSLQPHSFNLNSVSMNPV